MNVLHTIDELGRDAAYAVRAFARRPRFAAVVVLTLAVGIGATTAMYSAIDAAFLRPLPFPDPERLVRLAGLQLPIDFPQGRGRRLSLEHPDLEALRDVFSSVGAYATGSLNLASGPEPRRVNVTFVTTEFFATLERDAMLGRVFTRDETLAGGPNVAVLSDALWRSQFGADADILGRTITLDDAAYEIVGVMPRDFRFPAEAQLWAPLPVPVPVAMMGAFRNYLPSREVARLADGVSLETAGARLEALRATLIPPPPGGERAPAQSTVSPVTPLQLSLVGDRTTALTVLMASAALVLLVACANAATLLLARSLTRSREIAVHGVLGATRARLTRRLLVESAVLAGLAGVLGVAFAAAGLPLLESLLPASLAGLAPAELDSRVLAFAVGAAVATGLIFGIVPALSASGTRPGEALKTGGDRATRSGRLGRALVVAQVALAAVLVVGSVLMIVSLRTLLDTDLGLRGIERVASARLNLPSRYLDAATFTENVLERLAEAPAVEAAGAVNAIPFDQEALVRMRIDAESIATTPETERPFAPYRIASPGYFRAIGLELLRGRDFTAADRDGAPVVVINRTLAERLWPGEDPLGKEIRFLGGTHTVVGVVADARTFDLLSESGPQVYTPFRATRQTYLSFVVRGRDGADPATLVPLIRDAVRAVDPSLPIYSAEPMEAVVLGTVAPRRLNTLLSGVFGALALSLAGIGVYGVLAYSVAQRRREIGIRLALGAPGRTVVRAVMRDAVTLVAVGVVLGFAAAFGAARYLESLLYGITAYDPAVFGGVALLFLALAAAAAWLPARTAAAVDPLTTIRHE
jgi:predicted permease